jgi:two-component system chemotaxis sensor kinase CheA
MSASRDAASDLARIFSDEAAEHLDGMVECLLAVEAERASKDVIEELFRHAHSIKGSAGMVGFADAGAIASAIEDVLQGARDSGSLPPAMTDPLLRATDALRHAVAGQPDVAADAIAMLSSLRTELGPSAGPTGSGEEAPPKPETTHLGSAEPQGEDTATGPEAAAAGALGADQREGPEEQRSGSRSMRVAAHKVDRLLDVVGETVLHNRRGPRRAPAR